MTASGGLYQVPTIRLFETATGREWTQLSAYHKWVNTVVFSRDNKRLLSGGGYELLWWDLASGTVKHQFDPGMKTFVNCAAVSPNGAWVAAGYGGQDEPGAPREDCCVRLFDAESRAVVARWEHKEPVHAIAISHDSRYVLSGEEEGRSGCGRRRDDPLRCSQGSVDNLKYNNGRTRPSTPSTNRCG